MRKFENNFETLNIEEISSLKQPTIFFFLKEHGFSEHYIKDLRHKKDGIRLNGVPVTIREKITIGDVLEIAKNPSAPSQIDFCEGDLDIIFEDEDFLIVNKPHNLACIPTRSHYAMNLGGQICKYMQETLEQTDFVLRIANRLDRETAGIVVIAKNVLAYNSLNLQKEYHAICKGKVEQNITIDKPILTLTHNGINQQKRIISPNGKPAVTHVEILQYLQDPLHRKDLTLVKLKLETGRTHQIRVHMSEIGHPLVDDSIYNSNSQNFENSSHTMLLLKNIVFTHFRTGKTVTLSVPYPDDWKIYKI